MIFEPTPLEGAYLVVGEPSEDARGSFARNWCADTFEGMGLDPAIAQISTSRNLKAGTLRGLHLQRPPHAETKLVRAIRGRVFDVIVDLRDGSPSYGRWFGIELDAAGQRQLYVPRGFAHGFQTLEDGAELLYLISTAYAPQSQDGVRWDDPDLAIAWPDPAAAIVSDRDRALPPLKAFAPIRVAP